MVESVRAYSRDFWGLAWPYWTSEERWMARGLLAAIVLLNLGTVYVSVEINKWQATFYNALVAHDFQLFL